MKAPALLILAGILVYANSLSGVFTFDDAAAIVENESIRRLWPLTVPLSPPERGEPVAGRPLVNLSFALNYALHGLDVTGYHVVNVALHVACALLLFGLVRRTLRSTGVALAAALVWTVHPLLTEAVNYVSQRTELMMSLFYLLTLYASVRAHAAAGAGFSRLAVGACALGMACKETMVTAPVMVVLYDRVFVYPSLADAFRARWRLYAGLAATWVLLAALIWSGPRWESAGFSTGITPWTYLLNQAPIIVEYLKQALWPVRLVLDYGEPRALTVADVAWQAALVVTLIVLTVAALAKRPAVGFAAAAFFIVLAPTSSIVPIATEVGAERRMYLPLAALAVLAVAAARALPPRLRPAVLAVVVVALGALTVQRNGDYRDELRLWRTTLERSPQPRAHRNYATLLKRAGYRDEVIEHLRLSLEGHPEARYALGFELHEQRRFEEAAEELRRFAREVPSDRFATTARALAAEALLELGRYDEAIREYEAVAAAQPQLGAAWSNLGMALARGGRVEQAVTVLRRAVDLDPRNPASRRNLAAVLIERGDAAGALPHAEEAVRLAPSDAVARVLAAVALLGVGRLPEAEMHLRSALALDPSNEDARNLLARIEQTRRSGV